MFNGPNFTDSDRIQLRIENVEIIFPYPATKVVGYNDRFGVWWFHVRSLQEDNMLEIIVESSGGILDEEVKVEMPHTELMKTLIKSWKLEEISVNEPASLPYVDVGSNLKDVVSAKTYLKNRDIFKIFALDSFYFSVWFMLRPLFNFDPTSFKIDDYLIIRQLEDS